MTSMPSLLFTIGFEPAADKNSPQSKGRAAVRADEERGGQRAAAGEADTRRGRRERSI